MTEENTAPIEPVEEVIVSGGITEEAQLALDQLEGLKEKAKSLGITFSPKIGVDALREKINKSMEPAKEEITTAGNEDEGVVLTEVQRKAKTRQDIRMSQLKLVRLRINNMNPSKKDLKGEIFTVANKYLGTVKKFIPYGEDTDEGYHVPHILYEQLKTRKFLQIRKRKVRGTGEEEIIQSMVPEFALEVLPQLTPKELEQLARNQAAAQGL